MSRTTTQPCAQRDTELVRIFVWFAINIPLNFLVKIPLKQIYFFLPAPRGLYHFCRNRVCTLILHKNYLHVLKKCCGRVHQLISRKNYLHVLKNLIAFIGNCLFKFVNINFAVYLNNSRTFLVTNLGTLNRCELL